MVLVGAYLYVRVRVRVSNNLSVYILMGHWFLQFIDASPSKYTMFFIISMCT